MTLATASTTIDVRGLAPRERHPTIVAAFWVYVQTGPQVWRVDVQKLMHSHGADPCCASSAAAYS